ncbi:MAG: tail assembly chaperone [Anaerostipes sp.]|uniref:tail assembly chaperone n=1 Tax=Anaerostipes sp. TaxID=1872530 RepID=UPI00399587A0
MYELQINRNTYQFNFGLGFMRDLNKNLTVPVENIKGKTKEIGMRYTIAEVIDGDIEALEKVLLTANKGFSPRLERGELDAHIENEDTDIEQLFETVLGFLEKANVSKKTTTELLKEIANQESQKNQTE